MEIKEWMFGTLDEILETMKSGTDPEIQEDIIKFELKETDAFEAKRPDRDGSLNYGYRKPNEMADLEIPRMKLTGESRAAILADVRKCYQ